MEMSDLITMTSALIVALGWFVTGYLDRRKDIAQKRLDYRLKALESIMPVISAIKKNSAPFMIPGFIENLENAKNQFDLYGSKEEVLCMENFISAINENNLPAANSALKKLTLMVRTNIRRELRIN